MGKIMADILVSELNLYICSVRKYRLFLKKFILQRAQVFQIAFAQFCSYNKLNTHTHTHTHTHIYISGFFFHLTFYLIYLPNITISLQISKVVLVFAFISFEITNDKEEMLNNVLVKQLMNNTLRSYESTEYTRPTHLYKLLLLKRCLIRSELHTIMHLQTWEGKRREI